MSVYIKGVEMPESCDRCFVKFCEGRAKEERISVQRHESCPLVPIPLHGRLGDLDAIMTKLNETSKRVFGNDGIPECSSLSIVADYIEAAPTIIPASKEGKK